MLKIQGYIKTQKHIVMLQVEDEFAQKSDQIEASLKILLSQYFSGSSLGSGEKWCCPFWTMRGVALREPSGPRARADLQNIRFILFFFFLKSEPGDVLLFHAFVQKILAVNFLHLKLSFSYQIIRNMTIWIKYKLVSSPLRREIWGPKI